MIYNNSLPLKLPKPPVLSDVWTAISKSNLPIIVYGMGNAADKIAERLAIYGTEISDFFASDDFVRGQFFRGKKVLSYSEIAQKYNDFVIVLAFASCLPDVISNIVALSDKHKFFAPDLPVCEGAVFDAEFYNRNYLNIKKAYSIFEDEKSKDIYKNIINYKLSGEISFLLDAVSDKSEVWNNILSPSRYKRAFDGGAYNGDTIKELLLYADSIKEIVAAEPDIRTFKKLSLYAKNENRCHIELHNKGVLDKKCSLPFLSRGGRNSSLFLPKGGSCKLSEFDTIDNILGNRDAEYISLDLEGAEFKAVQGAINTILRCTPDILLSLYHRSEDLFTLPLLIRSIIPEYKLYLRRFEYIPAWDLNLYATV